MHRAFPKIEEIEEWKNPYTGKISKKNEEIECEKTTYKTQNKLGISRRNEFLNPSEKPSFIKEEKEEEAEIEIPFALKHKTLRDQQLKEATKLSGYSTHLANQGTGLSTETNTLISKRPNQLHSQKIELHEHSNDFKKSLYEKNVDQEFVVNLKQSPIQLKDTFQGEKDILRNVSVKISEEQDLQLPDLLVLREIQQHHNFSAQEHLDTTVFKNLDVTLDILTMRNVESALNSKTNLETDCIDLSSKIKQSLLQFKNTPKSFLGQMKSSSQVHENVQRQPLLTDDNENRSEIISTDIQIAIKKSLEVNKWKNDTEEQERVGTWAVEVLSKKVGVSPQNILSSLKTDSLRALGRLALQSLFAIVGKQSNPDIVFQDDLENDQTAKIFVQENNASANTNILMKDETYEYEKYFLDFSTFKSKINQIRNLQDLLKEEEFRYDLQCLQNGLQLEKTADEILESFLETLHDELSENHDKKRHDILTGQNAIQNYEKHLKDEFSEHEKEINFTANSNYQSNFKSEFNNTKIKSEFFKERIEPILQNAKANQEKNDTSNKLKFDLEEETKLDGIIHKSIQSKYTNRKIESKF